MRKDRDQIEDHSQTDIDMIIFTLIILFTLQFIIFSLYLTYSTFAFYKNILLSVSSLFYCLHV